MNERCFAMKRDGMCGALTVTGCPGYAACAFYKPIWKHKKDVALVNKKLCALPTSKQADIAERYHQGRMPWRGEVE